jgi:hypothetical protein
MAAGANTHRNVGIRRMTTQGQERNFEPNGTQTYVVLDSHGIDHAGTHYAKGATIAYDEATGTLYSDYPRMERDYNRGAIDPSS